jgi:AraC family transcriptional regulator
MNARDRNLVEYERRLHRVLAYIDAHLDGPIDLESLAKEAHFSPFHFHRIFAAHTGETLGNYLTRRRVETGAARLASQPKLGVLEVALAVGFGSSEAFSRAFKKRFGASPTQWLKQCDHPELANSKLSQEVSRMDQESPAHLRYAGAMETKTTTPLKVAIVNRPAIRFAYLRYQGPFGRALGEFWQSKVMPWLAANNLAGADKYGISQDDPEITEQNKCRYDAGAEVAKDFVPPQGAHIGTVPGGLYACAKYYGTSQDIPLAWQRILREWLPSSGYQLDARPCFEYYPANMEGDESTGAFECELCMPIQKL